MCHLFSTRSTYVYPWRTRRLHQMKSLKLGESGGGGLAETQLQPGSPFPTLLLFFFFFFFTRSHSVTLSKSRLPSVPGWRWAVDCRNKEQGQGGQALETSKGFKSLPVPPLRLRLLPSDAQVSSGRGEARR